MTRTPRWTRVGTLTLILFALSCVTINVYFPATEVEAAAERIVDEVYSGGAPEGTPQSSLFPHGVLRRWFGVGAAYAQVDIDVSTPAIRAVRASIEERHAKLLPSYDTGAVGISRKGYLEVRDLAELSLKEKAALKKLVEAENTDRKRLYEEIVKGNGLNREDIDQVEMIFAAEWRERARPGWWYQTDQGEWRQKAAE